MEAVDDQRKYNCLEDVVLMTFSKLNPVYLVNIVFHRIKLTVQSCCQQLYPNGKSVVARI